MTAQKTALTLPAEVSSRTDLKALQLEIREYARWYAHNAIKKQLKARHATAAPELTPAASALLRHWQSAKPLNRQSLDELIRLLADTEDHAKYLTITLAAPPTTGLKKLLVGWCRDNIAPDVLVNFEFNSTLLGGMVVRYGSRIFDWSFRRQILENRQQIAEALHRV
jgi:hypothetical protein